MKTTTTNFLTPKDIFVLFLFVGLFSCPGFSQLGNYQVMENEFWPETMRNRKTGRVLVYLRGPGSRGFVEVMGNGDLNYLNKLPDLRRYQVEDGDTLWHVHNLFDLNEGFAFQGSSYVKENGKTLYVSSVTHIYDWDYNLIYKYEPGHENPINSKLGAFIKDGIISFLGYEWNWVDSTYVPDLENLFRFNLNYHDNSVAKDTVVLDIAGYGEEDFMGGMQIGNNLVNFSDFFEESSIYPARTWIMNMEANRIEKFKFPFQIFNRKPHSNKGGVARVLIDSLNGEILWMGNIPMRAGDYPEFDEDGDENTLFCYYLDKSFEIKDHYKFRDVDYGLSVFPLYDDNVGPNEGFRSDTIDYLTMVNVSTDIEGTISQNTGEILLAGFIYLRALKSTGQVLERRYISRIDATGENYNPDYLVHVTNSYFFNTNKDSVTVDLKTTIDIDKYESAFLTIALDDMSLSTPKGLTKNQLRIYPNPTTDFLRFEAQQPGTYSIIDAQGRSLSEGEYSGVQEIDVRNLSPGSYQIVVQEQGKKLGSYPFLKR